MRCRYCGTENSGFARICVSCCKPMPVLNARQKYSQSGYVRIEDKGSGGTSPYLQYGLHLRARQFRRTHRLTAATQHNSPSIPPHDTYDHPHAATSAPDTDDAQTQPSHLTQQRQENFSTRPAQGRTEPHWSDAASPNPAYQDLHWQPPGGRATARRRLSHIMFMSAIFAVGAAVGLGAAWWLNKQAPVSVIGAARQPAVTAPVSIQEPAQGERASIRGISPGELPYDGAPPPMPGVQGTAADVARARPSTDAAEPGNGLLSNGRVAPPEASELAAPPVANVKSESGADVVKATPPAPASKPSAQSNPSEKRIAKAPVKRQATQTVAKDKEIERIRQQADEELKKKINTGRALTDTRARERRGVQLRGSRQMASTAPASYTGAMREMLARCERNPNFIRREQCKWKLCDNKWGKHGCPSYGSHASAN